MRSDSISFALWNAAQIVCGAVTIAMLAGRYETFNDAFLTIAGSVCGGATIANGAYAFLFKKNMRLLNEDIRHLREMNRIKDDFPDVLKQFLKEPNRDVH